jgi:hypothetical protein
MLTYEDRIYYLDKLLNLFSDDKTIKFNILVCIHYIVLFIIYVWFLMTKSIRVLMILTIIILIQLILNIIDDGCFMMKLERKYVGKHWYGGYNGLEYLGIDVNPEIVKKAYIIIMISIGAAFIYKLWRWK